MSAEATLELVITGLGAQGDGIASHGAERVFVPLALPGERVRVELEAMTAEGRRARLIEVLEPSSKRRAPPCPHFGACGGCALQHMADDSYVGFKLARLMGALANRGFKDVPLAPLRRVPTAARRRVRFAAARSDGAALLGFRAARDHAIIDLESCAIMQPAIERAIGPLREALGPLIKPRHGLEIAVTATASGLDVLLVGEIDASIEGRASLAAIAGTLGLARLSVAAGEDAEAETITVAARPAMRFAGVEVTPPPDAFIQPTAEGEAAIVEEVLGASKRVRRAADLFCGLGTIALPLAKKGWSVEAHDSSAAAIAALDVAARGAGLADRLKPHRHDLVRAPLPAEALNRFDLVVFDPPRAGAASLAIALARSKVPTVVAVSCNPATFARDARTLVDGGYRLERLTPLDQFLWTPHIEVIAFFRR